MENKKPEKKILKRKKKRNKTKKKQTNWTEQNKQTEVKAPKAENKKHRFRSTLVHKYSVAQGWAWGVQSLYNVVQILTW